MGETRKIAAILAADVVGYSRLAGVDEDRTLARLRALRSDVIDPTIAVHHGRVVKRTGDGALVEFRSVVEAVRCAVEVQNSMVERNAGLPVDRRIEFRIGIHLGDVVEESDGDLMGDGVNIAARLEGVAAPGAICLSEDAYRQVKARLDLSVSDLGAVSLKNIAEPIRVYSLEVGAPSVASRAVVPDRMPEAPERPNKPSIAVLPFQNMSGDPEQEYFADGMVEDIITALSRFKLLFVIARNSSFTYKGRAVDIKQVGRELGVRYVLEGSVRKAGGRVRITGQLIDSDTGTHLWADRFEGSLEDVFDLQDRVTASVVTAIAPKITQVEMERARRKPANSLDSYDLYLRALTLFHQFTPESLSEAVGLLRKAMEIDPSFAPAAALSLFCFGWWHSEARGERPNTDDALHLARQMRANPTDDPDVLWMVGWVLAYLAGETAAGKSLIDRGLVLNPNCAQAWLASGYVNSFANSNEAAIEAFQRAARLSPLDPLGQLMKFGTAIAHLQSGRYQEATSGPTSAASKTGFHKCDDRPGGGMRPSGSSRGRTRMGRPDWPDRANVDDKRDQELPFSLFRTRSARLSGRRPGQGRHAAGVRLLQAGYHNRSLCLYTKLGFRTREPISVLQGKPLGQSLDGYEVRPATAADVAACNRICHQVHGLDRGGELRDAIAQNGASVVEHLGRVTGYTTGIAFFGHSVAETNRDLMALIGAAPEFGGPGLLLPTRNHEVFNWCLDAGLKLVFQMTLMTVGLYNEPAGAYMPSVLY